MHFHHGLYEVHLPVTDLDLLSTLQMAAIRGKIRTVDIAPLKALLNRLGLRYNANDLRTPESTEKERQEETAAYCREHGLAQT